MNFNVDLNCIDESFVRIAEELMNEHLIKVKNELYRIVECEFYFSNKQYNHDDPYTHGHNEQIKNGSWYFHGSGIDITIGNKDNDSRGGILIRGLAKISNKQNANGDYLEVSDKTIGPLKVLTTLFSHFSDVFDSTNFFYLIHNAQVVNANLTHASIFRLPRIGLNIAKDANSFYNKA